jgi:CMP-N,N'-diacetyllegionaminic acid synthase
MKILGIIPARGGSKGIPGKNIKILAGKPLIQYTVEAALQSKLLSEIIVSTDSKEIAGIVSKHGLEVPFIRPGHLATETASSVEVVIHALNYLKERGRNYDAVCLLQPTSPFRKNGFIDLSINKFIKEDTDSLISVLPLPEEYNPHWIFEKNENGLLKIATGEKEIIKRRQELPPAYFRDGSVYITKAFVITDQKSLYGESISFLVSDLGYHVNIDTIEDWNLAETIALQFIP